MHARTAVIAAATLCSGLLLQSPASAAPTYTLADVQKHATPSDCWSVVAADVYDFTAWIAEHPGGRSDVEGMCGIDATAAFDAKHAADEHGMVAPAMAKYRIGAFTNGAVTPEPVASAPAPTPAAVNSAALVARHRTAKDCWTLVSGRAYNVTSWLRAQSRAATLAKAICGKDGTRALTTRLQTVARVKATLSRYAL